MRVKKVSETVIGDVQEKECERVENVTRGESKKQQME